MKNATFQSPHVSSDDAVSGSTFYIKLSHFPAMSLMETQEQKTKAISTPSPPNPNQRIIPSWGWYLLIAKIPLQFPDIFLLLARSFQPELISADSLDLEFKRNLIKIISGVCWSENPRGRLLSLAHSLPPSLTQSCLCYPPCVFLGVCSLWNVASVWLYLGKI